MGRTEEKLKKVAEVNEMSTKNIDTVIVALKHPQGIKFRMPDGKNVVIKGNATHLRGVTKGGIIPDGGFGFTEVSKEDWEYIKETYKDMNIFKSGLIFASSEASSIKDKAKDNDEIQSGFEPTKVGKNSKVAGLKNVGEVEKN